MLGYDRENGCNCCSGRNYRVICSKSRKVGDKYYKIKEQKKEIKDLCPIKNLESYTDDELLSLVKLNQSIFKYIKNPSETFILKVLRTINPDLILQVDNPTEEMQLISVLDHPHNLKDLKNPTEKVIMSALNGSGGVIRYVENPTENMKEFIIKNHWTNINYIYNPSEELQLLAIKAHPESLMYIASPTEDVILKAIKKDPKVIRYVTNPSETVLNYFREQGIELELELIEQFEGRKTYEYRRSTKISQ